MMMDLTNCEKIFIVDQQAVEWIDLNLLILFQSSVSIMYKSVFKFYITKTLLLATEWLWITIQFCKKKAHC